MFSTTQWPMVERESVAHVHSLGVMERFQKSSVDSSILERIIQIENYARWNRRARGLGVMTSPWHGEDRQFKSGRAHSDWKSSFWCPYPRVGGYKSKKYDFLGSKCGTARHWWLELWILGPITWIIGTTGVLEYGSVEKILDLDYLPHPLINDWTVIIV